MMTMMVVVMEMMTLLVAKLGKPGPPPVGNNMTIPLCDSQHSWSTLNRCEPRSKCSIKIKMINLGSNLWHKYSRCRIRIGTGSAKKRGHRAQGRVSSRRRSRGTRRSGLGSLRRTRTICSIEANRAYRILIANIRGRRPRYRRRTTRTSWLCKCPTSTPTSESKPPALHSTK